jgi:hypothetical protein
VLDKDGTPVDPHKPVVSSPRKIVAPTVNGRKAIKPESEFEEDDPEDEYEDDYEEDEEDDEEEEEEEDDVEEEEEEVKGRARRTTGPTSRSRRQPDGKGTFDGLSNFGSSLTVTGKLLKRPSHRSVVNGLGIGNILTVADDLLKNDGQKFLEMMEQLAERRMQREEEAAVDVEDDSEDEDDDDDLDDEDDEEDDEEEDDEEEEEVRLDHPLFLPTQTLLGDD